MKPILFMFLLVPFTLQAQDTTILRNTIGIFTDGNGLVYDKYVSMVTTGIVYKRMSKKYINHTLTAGYSNYITNHPYGTKMIVFNTSSERSLKKNVNMVMVGFGVEGQRRFYKKVYFTCGVELRAGYGTGTADTMLHMETYITPLSTGEPVGRLNVADIYVNGAPCSTFFMGLGPNIGAKLEFKRMTLGTMLINYIRMESSATQGQTATGFIDFNTMNMYMRLYAAYKF